SPPLSSAAGELAPVPARRRRRFCEGSVLSGVEEEGGGLHSPPLLRAPNGPRALGPLPTGPSAHGPHNNGALPSIKSPTRLGHTSHQQKPPPPEHSVSSPKRRRSTAAAAMGKVHGSLARAGKVRGQTPKVAKQDKKKQPRGRAHKRIQYNRRFVTAVVGFGKKRGPNSSEK
ncbi:uncharacterized protein LOC125516997, partial [Triticum urartu]